MKIKGTKRDQMNNNLNLNINGLKRKKWNGNLNCHFKIKEWIIGNFGWLKGLEN